MKQNETDGTGVDYGPEEAEIQVPLRRRADWPWKMED